MGIRDNKKRGVPPEPRKWSNEIIGIMLVVCGLVLLLALVSYSPADLPSWGFLEPFSEKSGKGGANFIGPVGGVLGFAQILLFGAAACLIPVALIWFGVVKMVFDKRLWPRLIIGVVVLLVAGACFLQAANMFFTEWAARCKGYGPGGVIGGVLGGSLLTNLIGRAGTLLLSAAAYLIALILLTGQTPVKFTKTCYRLCRLRYHEWRAGRSEVDRVASREAAMLAERERQRERRRKDREAVTSAAAAKAAPCPIPTASIACS